jgi:hypothetical protein
MGCFMLRTLWGGLAIHYKHYRIFCIIYNSSHDLDTYNSINSKCFVLLVHFILTTPQQNICIVTSTSQSIVWVVWLQSLYFIYIYIYITYIMEVFKHIQCRKNSRGAPQLTVGLCPSKAIVN